MGRETQHGSREEELVEAFLNEFMEIEYHGHVHHFARAHYRDVFRKILPKTVAAATPHSAEERGDEASFRAREQR